MSTMMGWLSGVKSPRDVENQSFKEQAMGAMIAKLTEEVMQLDEKNQQLMDTNVQLCAILGALMVGQPHFSAGMDAKELISKAQLLLANKVPGTGHDAAPLPTPSAALLAGGSSLVDVLTEWEVRERRYCTMQAELQTEVKQLRQLLAEKDAKKSSGFSLWKRTTTGSSDPPASVPSEPEDIMALHIDQVGSPSFSFESSQSGGITDESKRYPDIEESHLQRTYSATSLPPGCPSDIEEPEELVSSQRCVDTVTDLESLRHAFSDAMADWEIKERRYIMRQEELQEEVAHLKKELEAKHVHSKKSFQIFKKSKTETIPNECEYGGQKCSGAKTVTEAQALQMAQSMVEDSNAYVLQLKKDIAFLANEVERLHRENIFLSQSQSTMSNSSMSSA